MVRSVDNREKKEKKHLEKLLVMVNFNSKFWGFFTLLVKGFFHATVIVLKYRKF